MVIIKKINTKTVVGDVKKAPEGTLYTVIGRATGLKGGESNYGPWECLTGDFIATSTDGSQFRANKCFLPEMAHEAVAHQIREGADCVEFGFEIEKKVSEASSVGYEYVVNPLIHAEPETDPLLKLARLVDQNLQLEEPKKGAKK